MDGQIRLVFDSIAILSSLASNTELSKETREAADRGLLDLISKLKSQISSVTSSLKL